MILIQLLTIAIIGYLWGSIPPGYWMGKVLRGKNYDIRDHGSHKTGATNVLRTLGRVPALIVLLVDLSKGIGPALLATLVPFFHCAGWGPTVAGLAALLGHVFPVFIGFRGGRGVLTGAGAILVISPLTFAIVAVSAFITIGITRYVSLGSIVGCLTSIVCGVLFFIIGRNDPTFFGKVSLPQLVFLIVGPLLVIALHYDNIGRLLAGTERKLGQKVDAEENSSAQGGTTQVRV
jgi:acyl phosphate:glycerol-3-phosphate acyltransferase